MQLIVWHRTNCRPVSACYVLGIGQGTFRVSHLLLTTGCYSNIILIPYSSLAALQLRKQVQRDKGTCPHQTIGDVALTQTEVVSFRDCALNHDAVLHSGKQMREDHLYI